MEQEKTQKEAQEMTKSRKGKSNREELDENLEKVAEMAAGFLMDNGCPGDMEKALSRLLGRVITKVLDAEMDVHMGYDKGGVPPVGLANRRNGYTLVRLKQALALRNLLPSAIPISRRDQGLCPWPPK